MSQGSCWEEWKRIGFPGDWRFIRQICDFFAYLAPLVSDCLHPPWLRYNPFTFYPHACLPPWTMVEISLCKSIEKWSYYARAGHNIIYLIQLPVWDSYLATNHKKKRENGTTFFYPRNRRVQGMVFNSFSPFKQLFYPKNGGNLIPVHLREVDTIYHPLYISYTHNAIRHYCIFSFFIVCHLLGAYHYVRKKRLLEHKARVQPRSIPLRQKEQRYLIITYGKANILRGESNSSVVSKNSEQHCCVSRLFHFWLHPD